VILAVIDPIVIFNDRFEQKNRWDSKMLFYKNIISNDANVTTIVV
jgi:hypothetical protein